MQSKCTECGFKKSRFVREQEARHLLSTLGIKIPFSKIPLLNILTELHLKQPGFTYSACDPFTENKERIENLYSQEIQISFTEMSFIKLAFTRYGL